MLHYAAGYGHMAVLEAKVEIQFLSGATLDRQSSRGLKRGPTLVQELLHAADKIWKDNEWCTFRNSLAPRAKSSHL